MKVSVKLQLVRTIDKIMTFRKPNPIPNLIRTRTRPLTLGDGVQLWWPHTHGDPFLYEVRYDLSYLPPGTKPRAHHPGTHHAGAHTPGGDGEDREEEEEEEGEGATFVHSVTAMHGVRTISTHVDEATTGRVFVVNGVPIFLQVPVTVEPPTTHSPQTTNHKSQTTHHTPHSTLHTHHTPLTTNH